MPDRLFTIGFTGKTAEVFFDALRAAEVTRVVDVRLKNTSQLAGFTKRDDLRYFLKVILDVEYTHVPDWAPTREILDAYRADRDWEAYRRRFRQLLTERRVAATLDPDLFEPRSALLCSEAGAENCHRSLVAEHLRETLWPDLVVTHL